MNAKTRNNSESNALLFPFVQHAFSRGVLIGLVPAIFACIISRAPQYHIDKILGSDLPIAFDAISLIFLAPLYFVAISWLLLRAAERENAGSAAWSRSEIAVLRGLTALLAFTALFLLAQFFLILAPAGACDQRPHFDLLWTFDPQLFRAEHCMRSAAEINKSAWCYMQPVILQAWLNVGVVVLSLRFLWRGWQAWIGNFVRS